MRNRIAAVLALVLVLCAAPGTGGYAQEGALPQEVQVRASFAEMWGLEFEAAPGRTFDVYSGPGEQYLRAAEGKASVSTNGKVEFCGTDGDWVLIRYETSTKAERYGYVSADILPKEAREVLMRLDELETKTGVIQVDNGFVRDDTRVLEDTLRPLARGAQVQVIARLGDWLYVDDGPTNPDEPCRGFVWFDDVAFEDEGNG